ncbi:MAG: hypothetical protein K0Q65_443 [Clostridia bacterium]|jgi:hypothetical protein|nr:hypothetical protein [Clostridia bacterium]
MKSEITIQSEIRCALSQYGIVIRQNTGLFYNNHGTRTKCGFPGLSDLVFYSKNGEAVFIEVKTATGRASPEQLEFIERMQSYGYKAGICRSVEDALKLIGIKEE